MRNEIKVWRWVAVVMGPLLLYWYSAGPFFRWEHSARTWKEYESRKKLEARVYAPFHWLQKVAPSNPLLTLTYLNIRAWTRNDHFEDKKLPSE